MPSPRCLSLAPTCARLTGVILRRTTPRPSERSVRSPVACARRHRPRHRCHLSHPRRPRRPCSQHPCRRRQRRPCPQALCPCLLRRLCRPRRYHRRPVKTTARRVRRRSPCARPVPAPCAWPFPSPWPVTQVTAFSGYRRCYPPHLTPHPPDALYVKMHHVYVHVHVHVHIHVHVHVWCRYRSGIFEWRSRRVQAAADRRDPTALRAGTHVTCTSRSPSPPPSPSPRPRPHPPFLRPTPRHSFHPRTHLPPPSNHPHTLARSVRPL